MGNIGVSLAKELPTSTIYGCDIDLNALEIAKINKEKHSADNYHVLYSSYASNPETPQPDYVISDLPY